MFFCVLFNLLELLPIYQNDYHHVGHNRPKLMDMDKCDKSNLEARDCIFNKLQDIKTGNGGAVSISGSGQKCNYVNVIFQDCVCTRMGGAVYINISGTSNCSFSSCTFLRCQGHTGGAIYAETTGTNSQIFIARSNFENNNATSTNEIKFTEISSQYRYQNDQTGGGGAIFLAMRGGQIDSCTFLGNACNKGHSSNIGHYVLSKSTSPNQRFKYNNCTFYFTDATCKSSISVAKADYREKIFDLTFSNCKFYNIFEIKDAQYHVVTTGTSSNQISNPTFTNNCFYDQFNSHNPKFFSSNSNYQSKIGSAICPKPEFPSQESSIFTPSFLFSFSSEFSISNTFSKSEFFSHSNSFSKTLTFSESSSFNPKDNNNQNGNGNGNGNANGNENGNKNENGKNNGFPVFAYAIIAAGVVLIVVVVIFVMVLVKNKKEKAKNKKETKSDDNDDNHDNCIEMSVSKISVESNCENEDDEMFHTTSFSCVEDLDPFKNSFAELDPNAIA